MTTGLKQELQGFLPPSMEQTPPRTYLEFVDVTVDYALRLAGRHAGEQVPHQFIGDRLAAEVQLMVSKIREAQRNICKRAFDHF